MSPRLAAVAVALALAPAAIQPAAALELSYDCVCAGTPERPDCTGGGGIAGRHGQVHRDIPAGQVAPFYLTGGTGWSCLAQGSYACICLGAPDRPGCGNDAAPGGRGETHIALTRDDVLKNYAPGRVGAEATGWACVLTDIWTR